MVPESSNHVVSSSFCCCLICDISEDKKTTSWLCLMGNHSDPLFVEIKMCVLRGKEKKSDQVPVKNNADWGNPDRLQVVGPLQDKPAFIIVRFMLGFQAVGLFPLRPHPSILSSCHFLCVQIMRRVSALWNWRYDKQKWPVSFISLSKPIERSERIMLLDLNWKRSSFNNISSNAFWKFLPIYQAPWFPVIIELVNRTNFFGK